MSTVRDVATTHSKDGTGLGRERTHTAVGCSNQNRRLTLKTIRRTMRMAIAASALSSAGLALGAAPAHAATQNLCPPVSCSGPYENAYQGIPVDYNLRVTNTTSQSATYALKPWDGTSPSDANYGWDAGPASASAITLNPGASGVLVAKVTLVSFQDAYQYATFPKVYLTSDGSTISGAQLSITAQPGTPPSNYVAPCTGGASGQAAGVAAAPGNSGYWAPTAPGGYGYWIATQSGGVINCGYSSWYGSPKSQFKAIGSPISAIASTPDGKGYFLVSSAGNVYAYGDAKWQGSPAASHQVPPGGIRGIAVTASGGYYLVTGDGGVLNYGAPWLGSPSSNHNMPPGGAVGIATTPGGYWVADGFGGVFNYGTAKWQGSLANRGITNTAAILASGSGYLLTQSNGISTAFAASMSGGASGGNPSTVIATAADPSGGYWLVDRNGAIYSMDGATYQGGAN